MSTRGSLRREIEETRVRFHQLLESVPDSALGQPSGNAAWTIGEVLYHMSIAPRFLIEDVKMFSGQQWLYRLIPILVPKSLFNWLNARLTRFGARNISRRFLEAEYDRAHKRTMDALERTSEEEFQKSLEYPDWDPLLSGTVSMERLFRYVKVHFDSHERQIREILEGGDKEAE